MILHLLITDSHLVRVFRYESRDNRMEEIVTYYNAGARLRDRELSADRCGRSVNGPAGIRQTYEPRCDAGEYSRRRWLRGLTRKELPAACGNDSDGLVLVAPPRLLTELREGLSRQVLPPILAELSRNLSRQNVAELKSRLQPTLRAAMSAVQFSATRRRGRRRFCSPSAVRDQRP